MRARVLSALLLAAAPFTALEAAPQGDGLTVMAGLGLGMQTSIPEEGDIEHELGGAIDLAVGGFVQPNLALMFRIDGSLTKPDSNVSDVTFIHLLLGPSLQYWASDQVWLMATAGVSRIEAEVTGEVFGDTVTFKYDDQDLGLAVGGGAVVWDSGPHTVYVGFDLSMGFHDNGKLLTSALTLGWQML